MPSAFFHLYLIIAFYPKTLDLISNYFLILIMDRRTVLRSLAITVWGMVLLPGCDMDLNKEQSVGLVRSLPLTAQQKKNLEKLVDTFLPKTETLGAADLQIHHFLDKLIANCYPVETQELFMSGMGILEDKAMKAFGESFFDVDQIQRESILMELDNEDDELEKNFYDFVKEQVVNAYTTSEYFLTNFTNYDMVPGGYDGCVTIPEETFKI